MWLGSCAGPSGWASAPPEQRLPLARLQAGLHPDSGPAHLTHTLAALDVGAEGEAVWATVRCREASATWERPGLIAQVEAYAAGHPDTDVAPVLQALRATGGGE